MSGKKFFTDFQKPGTDFRSAPFWAWNAALDPQECRRQIRLMKKAGMGGFFMHSRVGLATEYLGKEYMDCIKACVDEAKKLDMKAWLYDEDRWPSGAAGGLVTCEERFQMKELYVVRGKETQLPERSVVLADFSAKFDGDILLEYRKFTAGEDESGREYLRCCWRTMDKRSWYNNQTYLDTMNSDAVKAFINSTHERYEKEIGKDFGGVVPGIFTDEPCYSHIHRKNILPWTAAFQREFSRRFHYDIIDRLPELFFPMQVEFSQARHDFYALATALFTENFSQLIGKWCDDHHMIFTGHVLCEDYLRWQTKYCGTAMRFYPYMGMPGIDLLTEHWNVFNAVKQCVSVAHQFGKSRRVSETYGCTGWDFPLLGHKALGDWQYALGINFRCQHLAWYSMKGEAKRDYPASISFQSPWFENYSPLEDYFARLGAAMIPGEEVRDVLVIHPAEAVWGVQTVFGADKEAERIDLEFLRLTHLLLDTHIDFDFGDEKLMADFGKISNSLLSIGHGIYKTVIIPDIPYLRPETISMLDRFAAAGGTVIRLGKTPAQFPGAEMKELPSLLKPVRRVSLTTPDGTEAHGVIYRLSESNAGTVLFLCNTSIKFDDNFLDVPRVVERRIAYPEVKLTLTMPQSGELIELRPVDGSGVKVDYEYRDGAYHCQFPLNALEAKLFFVGDASGLQLSDPECHAYISSTEQGNLHGYRLSENNVLVLDFPAASVNGKERKAPQYVLDVDDQLRKELGVPIRGGEMVQPWCNEKTIDQSLDFDLEYRFQVDAVPQSSCSIVVEDPEVFVFTLNGTQIPFNPSLNDFWIDPALRCIPIPPGLLQKGENILNLRGSYNSGLSGLESLYIIGDFGVENDHITKLPEKLEFGDWCKQGLSYYSGNLSYEFDFIPKANKRYALGIDQWSGAEVEVFVNGRSIRQLMALNGIIDLDGLIPESRNRVDVTVYGHRRNSMGPFFSKDKWPFWVGADSFREHAVEQRQLVPCGLLSEIKWYTKR